MGNEDPWFLLVAGALTLFLIAGALFIPIRIAVLIRQRTRNHSLETLTTEERETLKRRAFNAVKKAFLARVRRPNGP